MRITILGAGNGGLAAAADLTLVGHAVRLFEFPQFERNLEPIRDAGGIHLVGAGRTGFAKPELITTLLPEVLGDAELIVAVVPAFGHKPLAEASVPHLRDEQTVVLCPGSTLGSLEFLKVLRSRGSKASIKIAEVHTLPYAARAEGAEVRILLEVKKLWLAAFPARDTPEVLSKFKILYPVTEAGKNVMDVGLNNGNPIAHPAAALLNAGRVEYSKGEFYHYKEGITPHVSNVIQALDDERLALCRKLRYPAIPSVDRMYRMGYGITKTSLYEAYATSPVFCGEHAIKGPKNVCDRYFVEDTAYGLVTWSSLGKTIGVPTPCIDAVIQLISALHQKDYFVQGERSLRRLGLAKMSVRELNQYLATGSKPHRSSETASSSRVTKKPRRTKGKRR